MLKKLSHKLLVANIGIIVTLTLIFIYLSSHFSESIFSQAVNSIDLEVMENLSEVLGQYHDEKKDWAELVGDRRLWEETVNKEFFSVFFKVLEKSKKKFQGAGGTEEFAEAEAPAADNWKFSFGTFLQRVSLLDAQKKVLVGAEINNQRQSYQKIKVNGDVVGWLSVGKVNVVIHPLEQYFFKQQLVIVYWTVAIGGIVATLLSVLFSYHITAPIASLISGTRQIARRDYKIDIDVKTKDELQELADTFNYVAREMERFEQQRKQWLLDISHELRTPLAIMISEISAICDKLTKCDIAAVEALGKDVMQMKRLVDDLYDLAKIDEMGFSFRKEKINFKSLVCDQVIHYQQALSNRGIELHQDFPSDEVIINGDADRIVQVVRVLLENCCSYTASPGGVWLTIRSDGQGFQFVVEDSGPGVPQESLDKLFDRLYRTDASRNRATGGAGLGLAICKEIVQAHEGKILAMHSDKGGLCVQITFCS